MVVLDWLYMTTIPSSPMSRRRDQSVGAWLVYLSKTYKGLDEFDKAEWSRWIITGIQNVVSFPLACHAVYRGIMRMDTSSAAAYERTVIGYRSVIGDVCMTLLMGHGCFDLLHWCRLMARARNLNQRGVTCDYSPDWSLFIHHLAIPLLCPFVIYYDGMTSLYAVALILHEGASPFIVLRSLMLYAGQYGRPVFVKMHIMLDVVFQICHTGTRMIVR
jgi:hypothetical protein